MCAHASVTARGEERFTADTSRVAVDKTQLRKTSSWSCFELVDPSLSLARNKRIDSDDSVRSFSPPRAKSDLAAERQGSIDGGSVTPTSSCSESWEPYAPACDLEEAECCEQQHPTVSSEESSMTLLNALDGRTDKEFLDSDDALRFSLFWEAILEPFDQPLLKACQFKTKGIVYVFSFVLTFLTAVEAGLNWPVVLYALGMDKAARTFSLMLLTLSVFSQIPKRYIWRPRPWMVGRAKKVRADKTSSFPSRAAACATIFPLLVLKALDSECGVTLPWYQSAMIVSACIVSTGFARINVGAHYPSDIIAGVAMGSVVWWCGALLEHSFNVVANVGAVLIPSELRLLFAVAASFAVTHIFLERFWAKCSFVFGLLFGSLTYDFAFVPLMESRAPSSLSSVTICSAVVAGLLLLGYGMKAHKKKGAGWQMAVFAQMYCASLCVLMLFRF